MKGKINNAESNFCNVISADIFKKDHYYLNPSELSKSLKIDVNKICNDYIEKIDEEAENNADFLTDDIIRDRLDELFVEIL